MGNAHNTCLHFPPTSTNPTCSQWVACIFAFTKRQGKMDCKPIIRIVAKEALAIIPLRKVRGYADMAQQLSFVPKIYDKP